MNPVLLVASRELRTHLRKTNFYLVTLGLPLVLAVLVFFAGSGPASRGAPDLPLIDALEPAAEASGFGYVDLSHTVVTVPQGVSAGRIETFAAEEQGLQALAAGQIDVLFLLPANYRATGQVIYYTRPAEKHLADSYWDDLRVLLLANLMPEDDPALALRLNQPMQLRTVAISPTARIQGGTEEATPLGMLLPASFALLLSLSIFSSSSILLQALVEEKENRTIEVVVSSISPHQLLIGKVLGLGVLGLLQLMIWIGFSQLLLGSGSGMLVVLRSINLPPLIWLLAVLYFLLGYLLFASLMAGIGAVSPSMRETSQLAVAVTAPATAPILLLMPLVAEPNGLLALILSFFPLTAPTTMIVRQSVTAVPAWQLGLSLALLALGVAGSLWAAGKLFRASTLLTGRRLALGEIAHAIFRS